MKNTKLLGTALIAVITLAFAALSLTGCPNEPEPAHEHQWDGWQVTTAATCIAGGVETRSCALDPAHKETRDIAVDPDGHNYAWEVTTDATCKAEGEEAGTCSHNKEHTTTRAIDIDPDAHDWEAVEEVQQEPTCTEDGMGKITCTICETVVPEGVIDALGHDYQQYKEKTAATCTAKGTETANCTRSGCDETDDQDIDIDADAHSWNNKYTVTIPATCTATGIETDTCSLNEKDHTRTQVVAIVSTAHNYQNWTQTTAPTCTTAGVETETCTRDPSHLGTTTRSVIALEHNYEYAVTTAPTCTTAGIETGTCTRDQVTTTRTVAALGHEWGNWTELTIKTGNETRVCPRDETHTETRVVMLSVPGGSFDMGKKLGTANGNDITPVHTVTLTGFYIGKYVVTQAQWQTVMGKTQEQQQALQTTLTTDYGRSNDRPVYYVSWYEALVFCNKLSISEGLTPAYRINNSTNPDDWGTVPTSSDATWNVATIDSGSTGYRLPTEAQWEYAAKGGDPTAAGWVGYTYSGSDTVGDVAWFTINNGSSGSSTYGSKVVGTKAANRLGIYDMSGNVFEWCWDWYGSYESGAQTDPTGASSGSSRVRRGGGWGFSAEAVRSANRDFSNPNGRISVNGFRLVRPGN